MKTVTIWFNQWFSTAYHIINMIKENKETKYHIIGSSKNPDSVVKKACDEWYTEPDLSGEDYVNFCIEFCKKHSIEIFAARHNQLIISKNKDRFEKINVKLLADDFEKISLLHDKAKAYTLFKEKQIGNIPEYYIIKNTNEFKKAYKALSLSHKKICMKFTADEGATSFRIIDREPLPPLSRQGNHLSYEQVVNGLEAIGSEKEIMLMPLLDGNEVSVDCLKTSDGIIMIPRVKTNTRTEYIRYDEEILKACNDFFEKFGLENPCNIQFIYYNGIPYFLEINTRMSGGVQLACMATGINIPSIAINKLMGINKPWIHSQKEVKVSHVETPVILP